MKILVDQGPSVHRLHHLQLGQAPELQHHSHRPQGQDICEACDEKSRPHLAQRTPENTATKMVSF